MSAPVAIKGIRDGLLITLAGDSWPEVHEGLLQAIDDRGDFFHGARITLQIGERELGAADLGRLREELAERQVSLWAVLSESKSTRSAAADLGMAVELGRPAERRETPIDTELAGDSAVLVQRTLRSGNSLHHPGHVVVIGDVNPGAEIVAGGNVVVWGRLRGVVHAGAAGDETAMVCALDLAPTQLRIADHIAVSPERRGKPKPEMAHIRDGQLVAENGVDDRRR